ncbi:hypothetical protein [Novosphingobium guangzhouense]|uniref:Uncharacterized protein n=1 Tax=Novosphingobium guangzhouense TaxID=1850347 RepID=A0A2K2G140_9SPHN|nr:hypothetical protein [Novosphingobium guangzhouense]PNU04769.1 hypothetical protein A8V01_18615 [Novosphingobium guangzhouense]
MHDPSFLTRTLTCIGGATRSDGIGPGEIDYRDLSSITHDLTAIYARMIGLGLPASALASAMLGASVNFYDCFGMIEQLPELLRLLADRIEFDGHLC